MDKQIISVVMLISVSLLGCGGTPLACNIGGLSGTWRAHYEETNGTCGAIPDETAIFSPGSAGASGIKYTANNISADKCRADLAWSSTLSNGQGSQAWVLTVTQTSDVEVSGSGTVQATLGSTACRSTYNITFKKL